MKAWADSFIVRPMGDELLVYDLRTQQVTSLNPVAARVWRDHVDIDLGNRPDVEIDDPDSVETALDLLRRANLIPPLPVPPRRPRREGDNRRSFIRRFFSGAAAATASTTLAPTVISIVAPSPAEAATATCTSAAQCNGQLCTSGHCVACTGNAQCGVGKVCVSGRCQTGCTTNSNCTPPTGTCNTALHVCVGCLTNSQCSGATPICTSGTCTACTSSTQCSNGLLCISGSCVAFSGCTSNSQCSGVLPFCNLSTNSCVECLSNGNCEDAFFPVCIGNQCADNSG